MGVSAYARPSAASVALWGAVLVLGLAVAGCGSDGNGGGGSEPPPEVPGPVDPGPVDPGPVDPPAEPSDCGEIDSTYGAIQSRIFEARGCTADACHGDGAQGGLDLRADVSHEQLVGVVGQAPLVRPLARVEPGDKDLSLLYLKLAAATLGTPLPDGGGTPMPTGGAAPLTEEELQAVVLWIRGGAPIDGVVSGTEGLFGCDDVPEPRPLKVEPLAVPDPDVGFQLYSPGWSLPAGSENEVCFSTYYDLSDIAPPESTVPCPDSLGGPGEDCIAYHDTLLLQDGQSHHSINDVYTGFAAPDDEAWGAWTCLGGEFAGTSCDPTLIGVPATEGGADCGSRSACATSPVRTIACIGYGPQDLRENQAGLPGTQESRVESRFADGVFSLIPIRGIVTWNSHAFNLTTGDTTIEQYINIHWAAPEDQIYRSRGIFDSRDIFAQNVPPFESQEICRVYTLPQYARLTRLSSHVHERGVLFRIWDPPHDPCSAADPECVPPDEEPIYVSRVYNDATVIDYEEPRIFDQDDPAERSFKFCAVFDNGAEDPSTVKRQSTSPQPPFGRLAPGGPCADEELHCVGGDNQGAFCGGDDSICTGGGACDACPLRGGVTTEDEMFILLGGFFVVPPE